MIKLSDFDIQPIENTILQTKISDEEYFGEKYADYISNSRLRYINPTQNGTPQLYYEGVKSIITNYINLGSAVHQLFLESETYTLDDSLDKPNAKLGKVIDKIRKYRNENRHSISKAISTSCKEVDYYYNTLNQHRIRKILSKGLDYYLASKKMPENTIVLPRRDAYACRMSLRSLRNHDQIMATTHPHRYDGGRSIVFNEDVLLMNVMVKYLNKDIELKIKMKADNWCINPENKTITVNDLKTTSKPLYHFMEHFGSFFNYHYYRQMGMYSWLIEQFCRKEYNIDNTWKITSNIVVVETFGEHRAACFQVNDDYLRMGRDEFFKLIKMVAYYELSGNRKPERFE